MLSCSAPTLPVALIMRSPFNHSAYDESNSMAESTPRRGPPLIPSRHISDKVMERAGSSPAVVLSSRLPNLARQAG
jgi:hypothetical protein